MFKKGFDNSIEHTIDNDGFSHLGVITDGYSGSDITNVIREALMIPIRKCRNAKQFKLVENSDKFAPVENYPNCQYCPLDLTLEPSRGKICEYCGVYCKKMDDLDDDSLEVPPVTLQDVLGAIKGMQKSVGIAELQKYEEWTMEFGQEGR
jgi:vacuolar protein-sorting-associated protein 4